MQQRKIKRKPRKVRAVPLGYGVPGLTELREELQDMVDVLLGREHPPIESGTLTLMEVADAYYARAMEITMLLHEKESEGTVMKGSSYYKFRTGELRDFAEMAKAAAELGSRRLTSEQLTFDKETRGRESL
jgi:hypothetical protein